jgi:hypothetical protein
MSWQSHQDRIEYKADTIMCRTDCWVLTALGGALLIIIAIVWALL